MNVYRRMLADQTDQSVVVVTVGYLTNLRDLLVSGPDEYSDLSGSERRPSPTGPVDWLRGE